MWSSIVIGKVISLIYKIFISALLCVFILNTEHEEWLINVHCIDFSPSAVLLSTNYLQGRQQATVINKMSP